jgi:hypothetical protein
MFDYPLQFILRISRNFGVFLAINKNIHTQLCMNVKTHHHHINYLKLDYSIFSLKFVSSKVIPQKFCSPFFSWNPNYE